jgi:ferredoxin
MNANERPRRVYMAEFSGTGNTRYLGAVLEHSLNAAGCTVVRVAIEAQPPRPVLPDCDFVLIGAPVYHCAPPSNVVRFVRSLSGAGLPLATYLTLGLYSGDCARILQSEAEEAGFQPAGNFEARFPGSDFVALSRKDSLAVRLNRRISPNLIERARGFVSELNLVGTPRELEPKWYVPLNDLANRIAVPAYRRYKEQLRSDADVCVRGYLCVSRCPVHAIRPHGKSVVFDPEKCILCFRCFHRCPHHAIRLGDGRRNGHYPGPQIARNYEVVPEFDPDDEHCEPRRRPV